MFTHGFSTYLNQYRLIKLAMSYRALERALQTRPGVHLVRTKDVLRTGHLAIAYCTARMNPVDPIEWYNRVFFPR